MSELPIRVRGKLPGFRQAAPRRPTLAPQAPVVEDAPRAPEPAPVAPRGPVSRLARLLALAHAVERAVESGAVRDHAEAARRLGVSRARISQVASLLNLAPELQEAVILGSRPALTERRLRRALGEVEWEQQPPQVTISDR